MKSIKNRYIFKLSILVFLILFNGCNVLDQEPKNQFDGQIPITDKFSAQGALNGLYDALQEIDYYGAYFPISVDMFTEDLVISAFWDSYKHLDSHYVPATSENIKLIWLQMYRTINVANNIIYYVPGVDDPLFTQDEKNEIVGAAETIRGMVYFDLLRTFGEHWDSGSSFGVPIRIEPAFNAEFTPRSTVAQTYQQIITDLQNAESKLPDAYHPAYMNKQTVAALLARTSLYLQDYEKASEYASAVITSGNYALQENYASVFSQKNSSESIFELNFSAQDPSYYLREFGERDEATISPDFFDIFDENDTRRATIFPDFDNENLLTTEKYITQDASAFIIRLAEMYTIRAEANAILLNDPNAGIADLNVIRERAGLSALQPGDLQNMPDFINILLEEKRREFYAEGHRYFDLARHQKMEEVYGIENFRSIFPIPFVEILTASGLGLTLQQNPGY
jgi:hypothetical protein